MRAELCAGYIRDIGLFANTGRWTVTFGGNGGRIPRIGNVIGQDLAAADALDLVKRLLEYYRCNASEKERTSRFVERIGISRIKSEVLSLCPYLALEDAD
jgi:NAD(P)H-nitrite reductase large subunit